jgi:hypothetical protein
VYAPGASVVRIADSSEFDGAKPEAWICAAFAAPRQSSLVATVALSEARTSVSVGLESALAMPYCVSDGPLAVITTVFGRRPADHEAADHPGWPSRA